MLRDTESLIFYDQLTRSIIGKWLQYLPHKQDVGNWAKPAKSEAGFSTIDIYPDTTHLFFIIIIIGL